jgi:hypothetical protein
MKARRPFCLAAALCLALAAPSFGKTIFTLSDPRGDDHGDGRLTYPLDSTLNRGDLDLLSLTAKAAKGGTWFEAVFARPIAVPTREVIDGIGTQLSTVARHGFYTFNLDVYIDRDRQPGSGAVEMLPGRLAEVDPAHAWDRAVVLTPRPHEARAELKRMLLQQLREDVRKEGSEISRAEADELKAQVPGDVENRVFFPNKIRVRGTKISFFVPDEFLGGPARADWSYVAVVSGANLLQSFDPAKALGLDQGRTQGLMILPVSPGTWHDRFGGGRDDEPLQPPILDAIVPAGRKQETLLDDFDSRAERPVVLPGVVPAEGEL